MNKIVGLVNSKQTTIGSAALVLMGMVVLSAALGLIRLRVLYSHFTPEETGIFFAALRLPNLIFDLFVAGSLSTAFIPVFSKLLAREEEHAAHRMMSVVINTALILMAIAVLPLLIWTREVSRLFAPGFSQEEIAIMASYTRYMLLLQVTPLVIGNFLTGMLQSYQRFIVPALAPILYNIGLIVGIILFQQSYGLFSAVIGIGIGAGLFLFVQIPLAMRLGFRYRLTFDTKAQGVREVGRLVVPRLFGIAASQIDITVDLILSTLLGSRMVTVFYLAQNLQHLPVRLFGNTIAQAALPTLSSHSVREDKKMFRESVFSQYHMILFLILPVSAALIVMRVPVVRLVYGASLFDWEATVLTAYTLSAFSISMFSQALGHVFARAFYALSDTKTPVLISSASILLNVVLSSIFILVLNYPVWWLGISTSTASIVNTGLLLYFLRSRMGGFTVSTVFLYPARIAFIAFVMAVSIYVPMKVLDQLVFDTTRVFGLVWLVAVSGGIGAAVYLYLCWLLGIRELGTVFRLWNKIRQAVPLLRSTMRDVEISPKSVGEGETSITV